MRMLDQLLAAFRDFNAAFGLTPAPGHDYDLPDEPAAVWPPRLTDSPSVGRDLGFSRADGRAAPLRLVARSSAAGPTASDPSPGAVGHLNDLVTRFWTLLDALQHFVGELDELATELTGSTVTDPGLKQRLDGLFSGP